jgi:hypothetical protein
MTKYLDSPLKITGILLTLTGILLSFFTTHPSIPEGYSLAVMGIIMLVTAWMITHSRMSHKDRSLIEIVLVMIIILFSVLMALDYYGIIAIQQFLSATEQHTNLSYMYSTTAWQFPQSL